MRVDVVWSRRGGSCRTVFFLGAVVVIPPLIPCGHAVGLFLIVYSFIHSFLIAYFDLRII